MTELYYYEVAIYKTEGAGNRNKFVNEKVKIAIKNDRFIIIDDFWFTKLEKKKQRYACYPTLNNECISIRTGKNILGDGVFYKLYSEKKVKPSTIKRHMEKKIEKEFGFLCSVDLSIVK